MAPHRATIRHATLTYDDDRNAARTVRGIGFQCQCSCGESFRIRASMRMAQADKREHLERVPA